VDVNESVMKSIFSVLLIVLLLMTGCISSKPATDKVPSEYKQETVQEETHTKPMASKSDETKQTTNFYDQTTWVLGYFTREQISRPPHSEWFLNGYNSYKFNPDIVNKLTEISKEGITIKIVMGTWCPDSRREVPRFMRIIDEWNFPMDKITFIGVDIAKLSPVREYDYLNIERVPTFIFYKNNIELGRIIENPKTSLEQDMVNILTRNE
jgi:thiol-disulfide isomerase/thioredoxin